ncbi:MAG: antibiotic biosynthesis monooxygenase [Candidatus Wallbacteria bacterium]|nr:antibiotic biosynthesis monooxygenase [Candidatus Wallbacteria bacterium]
MITVGMNYVVRAGKESVFEEAFRSVLEAMKEMAGHRESHLYRDVDNARSYLIVSLWDSRESFSGFMRSERFARVVSWGAEQILEGRPKHEIYEQ